MFRKLLIGLTLLLVDPRAEARAGPPACTCREGNACYHYLRAPVEPPDHPCSCELCRVAPGGCSRKLPEGWDKPCAENGKMECFLRRHGASWGFTCSEQIEGTCECGRPHPERCPSCGEEGTGPDAETLKILERQIEVERRILGPRREFVMIKSPHFYLVTDIRRMKVRTQEGRPRIMGMHEIAHQFAQRAEIAYRDFVAAFGDKVYLPRPSAVYLLEDERTKEEIAERYFGLPGPELFYGGDIDRIGGGYPYNGLAISYEKYDDPYGGTSREEDRLHFQMRHLIGHLLISCWVKVSGDDQFLPRWMYAGAGHWLSRLPERFGEMATFCSGEGKGVRHRAEDWSKRVRRYALDRKAHPVQMIFDVNSLGALDLEMHVRAWSWFDLWLREDPEPFLAFLASIREGTDERTALEATTGLTPDGFDRRWRDRVLGRRESVAPTPEELDAVDPDAPGVADREAIRAEKDLPALASRIKALRSVDDPLTAATIVPLLHSESEAVRETIVAVLSRTTSAEVREWLRTTGLSEHSRVARAYVARILANLGDAASAPALLSHAGDDSWLTRAHVARAMGVLRHEPAIRTLEKLAGDRAGKVRIAAIDALAAFGERAAVTWEAVADHLGDGAWQVRSAAAGCLGALGDMRSVEALISRMEQEDGRVREDIHRALVKITRDDLGRNPKYWRDWWEKLVERHPDGVPPRPEGVKDPPKGEHDYAPPPTYYGLRIYSRGVGYVIDTSSSMSFGIRIDPEWLKRHRRDYPAEGSRFEMARREVAANLGSLDPRTRFNLYFFRSTAFRWENRLVPATSSNVKSALGRFAAERPPELGASPSHMTNYVAAFRELLDAPKGDSLPGSFGDTPDTVYFLTDGNPTVGEITDPELFRQWFRERNRFARIHLHIVVLGRIDVNREFLKALAAENGGTFVEVPEAE